ncbi:hypothetical protein B0H17DRAFT_1137348 [Mycena rosella]|uniref:Uncharacterized protein n=1 Tax=Mycena rosella TaxID=1033263 RepID=A0AAD7D9C7_MYCRO|nr:hypothetical protein B0H17DRAFT_1137348 [Mycena rosella]
MFREWLPAFGSAIAGRRCVCAQLLGSTDMGRPSLDYLLDPPEERVVDEPTPVTSDASIVAQVRHEAAVERGEIIEIDDEDEESEDEQKSPEMTTAEVMKLCRTHKTVCLSKGDLTQSMELSRTLQQFRGNIQREETKNARQLTLSEAWGATTGTNSGLGTPSIAEGAIRLGDVVAELADNVWSCPFDPGYCPLYATLHTQVYQLVHTRQFRAVPQATAFLQTYQYHQLPPFTFLTRLSGVPTIKATGIKLTPGDASLFKDLNSSVGRFNVAVKASRKCKKATEIDAEMDEEA